MQKRKKIMNMRNIITIFVCALSLAFTYPADKPVANAGAPFSYVDAQPEFDKMLKENKLVVVQFFNPTCPVCMAFKRKGIFGKAAKALPHIKFAMTSSETGAALHSKYGIKAFPTFIFFKNGQQVGEYKGYVEAKIFIKKITDILGAAEPVEKG